jgi:3',5'-cyclic-AMP phosphodiesterase
MSWRPLLLLILTVCAGAQTPGPASSFHFSIVGDRTGTVAPGVYEQVWSEIDRLHPSFVINVGDTIQGRDDKTVENEWQAIRPILEPYRRYPFYYIAGNHDIWSAFSRQVFERETGRPATYSFDYQGAHFVVLDNSGSLDLGPDQLQFLEADLKANRQRHPKFVFFHQPFWLGFLKMQSGEFPLHRLAREYGVDYVISGHGHFFARIVRDGVAYMQLGSSGAKFTPDFARGAFYQYASVEVQGAGARIRIKELGAPFGKGRSFAAEDWDENGPRFRPEDLPGQQ